MPTTPPMNTDPTVSRADQTTVTWMIVLAVIIVAGIAFAAYEHFNYNAPNANPSSTSMTNGNYTAPGDGTSNSSNNHYVAPGSNPSSMPTNGNPTSNTAAPENTAPPENPAQ